MYYFYCDFCRETKVYLNCDQGVGLKKSVVVADGEIEERLHYVSWFEVVTEPCIMYEGALICQIKSSTDHVI